MLQLKSCQNFVTSIVTSTCNGNGKIQEIMRIMPARAVRVEAQLYDAVMTVL
jgi:hypothetical protein